MTANIHAMASRKTSGGSARSGPHSPSSPGHPHSPRHLTPAQSSAMLGVGMGPSRPLKVLSPTWQVWSGAAKRTASNSTVASTSDRRDSPNESNTGYRSLSDGWRPGSKWDDVVGGNHKEPPSTYDTMGHQSGARARQTGPRTLSGGHPAPRVASGAVDNDLSRQLRGMAVEDDYASGHSYGSYTPQIPATVGPVPGHDSPHMSQQPRSTYRGGFAQADFASYPGTAPTREAYADYPFPYDVYRPMADPAIYAASSPVAPVFPTQPAGFFDYNAAAMAPAGFYFTSPGMIGPPLAEYPILPVDYLSHLKQPLHMQPAAAMGYPAAVALQSSPHTGYARQQPDYSTGMPMAITSGVVYPSLNAPSPATYPHRLHPDRRRGDQQGPQGTRDRDEGMRSAILEDFRANKSRRWELKDILGHVVEFSADQHGSRFIQHRLDTASPDVRQKAFDEIVPQHVMSLVQDVFGNYVIQKLFEHGTGPQKAAMVAAMENNILPLSLNMYGCRVVQKAIDFVGPDLQAIFVRELEVQVMRCVKDANGNHVVQKLIERVPPERLSFIASFVGNVYELASHPYGCRVLQRCLEHLGLDATRPLLDELQKYIFDLMQDQFGNYVVQFLCENGEQKDRAAVVDKLRGQLLSMSKHKFASNVVEKALITADSASRELLIDEILMSSEDGQDTIALMMKDQYANYVLQRAMLHAEGQQQLDLCNRLRPQLLAMRKLSSVYTKHLNSIERCLNKIQRAHGLPTTPTSTT